MNNSKVRSIGVRALAKHGADGLTLTQLAQAEKEGLWGLGLTTVVAKTVGSSVLYLPTVFATRVTQSDIAEVVTTVNAVVIRTQLPLAF